MARNQLTETKIKALTTPGVYADGDGLYIRVAKGGSKSWTFIWRRGKDRHEIGLGGHGRGTAPVSLTLAREKADAIRNQLARGEDPRTARRSRAVTFADCMAEVLKARAPRWKNAKHAAQWTMTLREYAKPLHGLPVAGITVRDVKDCVEPYWTATPETGERLRSRIEIVINHAIALGYRTDANPAVYRGLLENVLGPRQKLTRGHHAAAAYKDAPTIARALAGAHGTAARAVEFVMLTAARTGEARGATWGEIDFDVAIWTVPANRMKAGKEHRVPLSTRAIEILADMRARGNGDSIFADKPGGAAVSDTAMTKSLRRAAPDATATLHGLRSTFRDWAGDVSHHPRDTIEAALAHTLDATEGAYRRSDALAKRRALMQDWCDYLRA